MDPITDLLSTIRVQGVCYGRIQATAPWGLQSETGLHARFGLISQGQCWLILPDASNPIQLSPGDFFLLAPGRAYVLADDLETPPRRLDDLLKERCGQPIIFGGAGVS